MYKLHTYELHVVHLFSTHLAALAGSSYSVSLRIRFTVMGVPGTAGSNSSGHTPCRQSAKIRHNQPPPGAVPTLSCKAHNLRIPIGMLHDSVVAAESRGTAALPTCSMASMNARLAGSRVLRGGPSLTVNTLFAQKVMVYSSGA
jgi:hypothetical protein